EKTIIHLPGNKTFTILAQHASKRNVYIQKATLNGKVYSKNYLSHADIAKGGVLQLMMGDKPNKTWGSLEEDCPPAK
ncbi:MAG TPA: alpha-mannosidase, partial [Prevotella sp.]|nr:alpha-mannosidase [Prevotella sp.]